MIPLHSTSRVIALALFAWGLAQRPASVPAPPDGTREYTISREVNVVVLPVTVTTREGEFVSGLAVSNFRVYENGRLQTITDFRSEDVPVSVGIVVDHSGSMIARRDEVIAGAMAFVEASNPQDEEFVINFADRPILALPQGVLFTGDANELKAALFQPYARGHTALNDAIVAALEHIRTHKASKKVLILISDGGDNASRHTFAQALHVAQSENAAIYTVGLLDEYSADQNPAVLQKLAKETGGLAYFPGTPDEVVDVCRRIARDIRHQYTISYSASGQRRGEYRKISVTVMATHERNLLVRTRAGYYWLPKTAADHNGSTDPAGDAK
jgi:Ca-activated chloride channel family protein